MGLFDWLSDAMGSGGGAGGLDIVSGGNPMQPGPSPMAMNPITGMEEPRRHLPPMPTGPMPPMQMTGMDKPLPPDPMAPGSYPPPGLPMTDPMQSASYPPTPFPMADAMAGGSYPNQPPMPPGGGKRVPVYGGSTEAPPGPPMNITPPLPPGADPASAIASYRKAGGTMMDPGRPDIGGPDPGPIGRALGLDVNKMKTLTGALGAGFKAAGANSNKGRGAAFMGTAGSAMEGGQGRDDKTVEQQGKVLDRATRAKEAERRSASADITDQLNISRTKLAEEQAKMAKAGGGPNSVMNSAPQLYLRAMGLVNNDPEVKLAKSAYDSALKLGDAESKEVKAAKKTHEDLVKAKTKAHFEALGIDPKLADKLGKQPGMSQENPMATKGMTQQQLNALPPGTWVIGPDGKPLVKKGPPAGGAGANQPAPAPSMTPAVQPPIPPAKMAMAQMEADDEE